MTEQVELRVNNAAVLVEGVEPRLRLVDLLRERLGLTSVHVGCEQGVCGACTVLIDDQPAKSCIVLAFQVRGCHIETVESLTSEKEDLHPIQKSFRDLGGLQCGFCTPGMVLSARALLRNNPEPSESDVRTAISGNLCRCTGYEPIVDAVRKAASEMSSVDG
jgi:aerobic carbon-monoxide dehydrogenase small subunit